MLSAGVAADRLDIEALARLVCANTAKVFGLYPRKGAVQAGSDADLVIIDPTIESSIEPGVYHGVAHQWSPFFGHPIHRLARLTMVRGTVVMDGRELVDASRRGRYLRRPVAETATTHAPARTLQQADPVMSPFLIRFVSDGTRQSLP